MWGTGLAVCKCDPLNSRYPVELKYNTMERDFLRDGILVVLICIFISQVYISTSKVIAREKAVKIRYLT